MRSAIGLAVIVSGCAVTPNSIVLQPTTAKPVSPSVLPQANGAIFQTAAYRPLFEDRRARMIGDILTIVITEKTSAGKASANSSSKTGSTAFAAPLIGGAAAFGLNASSANKLDGKGAETASNNFTGTLGVTVVDVLQNGNLVVSGEKQIAFDGGAEFVRFSGVVSPLDMITAGNVVASTKVADARVEYRTNSQLDNAQVMSLLSRFFLSFIPL